MRLGPGTGSQRPAKAPAPAQAARTVAGLGKLLGSAAKAKPGPKRYTVPTAQPTQRISASQERANQQQIAATRLPNRSPQTAALFAEALNPKPGLHFAGKVASDLTDAALNTPAGIYHTSKTVGLDLKDVLPPELGGAKRGAAPFTRTAKLGEQIGKATWHDLTHPGEHPGYTILDVLGIASGGAGAATRLSAAGRAAAEAGTVGEAAKAALTRAPHEGGSLLRRPAPGETTLTMNGKPITHRLEPDNPLLRPVHRARTKAMQNRLDHPMVETPQHTLGKLYAAFSDPHNVVGRELRANAKVAADVAKAPAEALRHEAKKLSRPEHAAMRVVAIEGQHALDHPGEAVQRHIDTHLRWASEAKTAKQRKLHENVARDLGKALPVLQNPGDRFLHAVESARALAERMARESIKNKLLTPESARSSLVTAAKAYASPNIRRGARGEAPSGSFYFPTGDRFQLGAAGKSATPFSPRPGKFGQAPPEKGRYTEGTLKRRTGKALARGVVEKPAEAIAQAYSGRQKLYSAQDLYRHALRASTEKKQTEFQIPIRNSRAISNELRQRQTLSDLLKRHAKGDESALQLAIQEVEKSIRVPGHENADIGHSIPGVRWVDHRLLKEVSQGTPGKVSKAAKAINSPFRTLGVYARPAYIATNKPQNYLMQMLLQGVPKASANLYRANRAGHLYGDETKAAIRSAMGTARSASYAPRGRLNRAERGLIHGLSTATDQDSRMAAFLYRARERGYKGKDGLARLFSDPGAHHDLQMVTRRARKDAVDFDSLTPGEHALSDAVYFYPWMSRASAWAGRTALNRPIKTAALAQQGRQAQASGETLQAPSFLKGYLKTPAGVVNTNPTGPFSTPAQIGESLAHWKDPAARGSLAQEFGTPLVQFAASPGTKAIGNAIGSTAPGRALKMLGVKSDTWLGKPGKTFPEKGPKQALGQWLAGGLFPRKPDNAYIAKGAKTEQRANMSPVERTRQTLHAKRLEYLYAARKVGLVPKDAPKQPEPVRHAFDLRAMRKLAYVHEAQGRGKPLTEYDRFMVDQALLLDRKKITVDQANAGIKWAKQAKDREIRSFRHQLGNRYFGGRILDAATRQLNAHGADVRLN